MPRVPSVLRLPGLPDRLRRVRLPRDLESVTASGPEDAAGAGMSQASAELLRFYALMARITSEAPMLTGSQMRVWDPLAGRPGGGA
ncbi:MAG: hypothetical protein M3Z95_06760 [Actinomycetota bacterium]|nr:hypothetical protein [Actinomycetota bacterium]